MAERVWQVLIADLKASREIPARERPRVDRALRLAIQRILRAHGAWFRLVPQVLKGDELQAVLKPDAPALTLLTHLRARLVAEAGRKVELRAGIGRGAIARLSPQGPFASEGEAFHRARAALDQVRRGGGTRLTGWSTGEPSFDAVAEGVLGLMDAFMSRWTVPQWEAVAGRLEGKGLHDIARERRIAFQSVSKRLRAASWGDIEAAMGMLEQRGGGDPTPPAAA